MELFLTEIHVVNLCELLDFLLDFLYFNRDQKQKTMKPFANIIATVVMLGLCLPAWSQNLEPPQVKNNATVGQDNSERSGSSSAGSSAFQQNYLNLGKECGMYLCEEWKPGTIELDDGTVLKDRMIRYNIYNQQMEYAIGGDTAAIGNPEDLARLLIEDKTFVYRRFHCNNKERQGYLELLVEGEYELLLHRGIKYEYEEADEGSGTAGTVTRYYQANRYFLSCHGKTAESLPDKKNEIIAMIDKDEKKLKQYVKENKCKLKDQDEIMAFFVFVNKN